MNTTEINKKFAEFLGVKLDVHGCYEMYGIVHSIEDGENETHFFSASELKFHNDWNWLMSLIIKIRGLVCESEFTNRVGHCLHYKQDFDKIYSACSEFVIWYNESK